MAQMRPVGLIWELPDTEIQIKAEAQFFYDNGFNHVYLIGLPNQSTLSLLRNYQMNILVQLPIYYLTTISATGKSVTYQKAIDETWDVIRTYPYLTGYSIFYEGMVHNPDFMSIIATWRPSGIGDNAVYYTSTLTPREGYFAPLNRLALAQTLDNGLKEALLNREAMVIVRPASEIDESLYDWYQLFRSDGTGRVYFPASKIMAGQGNSNAFLDLVNAMRNDPAFILPSEITEVESNEDGLTVLFFLVLCVVIGVHYSFDPTYRKSLHRFFQSNRFFVEDLVQRRLKLSFSNYLVGFYICVLYGVASMSIAEFSVKESGFKMITHFLPYIDSNNLIMLFFLMGMAIGLVLLFTLVPWGGYMNKGHCNVTHYATIVMWPQHILIALTAICIVIVRIYPNSSLILVVWMMMLLVPVISYAYASIKLVRYSFRSGLPYLLLSFIPPFSILAALGIGFLYYSIFPELFELAIILP